jgi:hypothetical protein
MSQGHWHKIKKVLKNGRLVVLRLKFEKGHDTTA